MSYSFFSIVNTLKDKSSEAISTLSSDLKDFTAIVQEDVAEISKTVRQTVQEKSEQLRQRAEEDAAEDSDAAEEGEAKPKAEKDGSGGEEDASGAGKADEDAKTGEATDAKTGEEAAAAAAPSDVIGNSIEALRNSLFSFNVSSTIESLNVSGKIEALNVGGRIESLESMGSKLLNSADKFLGALSGENAYEDSDSDGESEELSARRFRLLALQEDAETYVDPPLDLETFQKWKAATPATELAEVQAEVLEHYPTVRAKFSELVPSAVDADTFWAHYIYKASLLAAQEQRGADLLEHALNDDEEEIGWDVESPKNEEASEEKKSLFVEEESKEEPAAAAEAVSATPDANTQKPSSSTSSDGESWIELDERKEQQAPLSTSSAGSAQDASASSTPSPAPATFKPKDASIAEGDDGLDWGDDEDAEKTAKTHADKDKHGEDWGEWD